jgi:colanic acid/amylovoran biosynthesis glycosyltransferase
MIIAYFVNQYPKPSHTFIRREIFALEARGNTVHRYALKSDPNELVDPEDLSEQSKTRHVFKEAYLRLGGTFVAMAARQPRGMVRALSRAIRMGWRSDRGLLRHLAYWVEAAVVSFWCRDDSVQHLHAHFGTNPAAVALLVHDIIGLPYSFSVHGPDEFDRPEFIALGEKIRGAAFVVAISSFGRSQLMRWIEPEYWPKIKVVHCGLDHQFRAEKPTPPPRDLRLVCVGRLGEQKGHLVLLEAMHELCQKGLKCETLLVGDGPMRSLIEQRASELGLRQQVTVTGWLTGSQVREELCQSRALVLPSFAEGLPIVIMEAMAVGRPVISTWVAGIPELVVPGETGWLVPPGDAVALSEAMKNVLLAEPENLAKMGKAGRERVLDRHDIAHGALKLESLMSLSIAAQSQI